MELVFFGSGPVAAESLRLLAQAFTIEAVITKPRPAHYRGPVPVLELAYELQIPTHTATTKLELDTLFQKLKLRSTVAVLVDFGIIVSQLVIDYFPLGIINSHFSLLPQWRGADPITFAILSGQKVTGVSLMLIVPKMDEGPLLSFEEFRIPHDFTSKDLTHALLAVSHSLLVRDVPRWVKQKIKPQPQSITGMDMSYSRKLTKQDGTIDWSKSAETIEREIRAFIDWPGSRTLIANKDVLITKVSLSTTHGKPGSYAVVNGQLMLYTQTGSLCVDTIKPAGKREMTGQDFIRGYL